MSVDFSVIIPLYNKEREIEATLRSAAAQTLPPREIIVVDDGSTDDGAAIVERLAAELTAVPIHLVRQENSGVSAARNRGVEEAAGKYIALLDGDDVWEEGFLAEIAFLVGVFPDCGLYATAFNIADNDGLHPAPCYDRRGIVDDFFAASAHRYIAIPSAVVIKRDIYIAEGGFPRGMKMGEDLYLWIKIARRHRVCYSPERLVRYSKSAANRSAAIYTPEQTAYSFEELLADAVTDSEREFIARAALGKALVQSAKGGTEEAARAARTFAYTRTYRTTLYKVRVLNLLPVGWRQPLLNLYNVLAWRLARRGL